MSKKIKTNYDRYREERMRDPEFKKLYEKEVRKLSASEERRREKNWQDLKKRVKLRQITSLLTDIWLKVPELRFGQLITNIWRNDIESDIFFFRSDENVFGRLEKLTKAGNSNELYSHISRNYRTDIRRTDTNSNSRSKDIKVVSKSNKNKKAIKKKV